MLRRKVERAEKFEVVEEDEDEEWLEVEEVELEVAEIRAS